MGETIACNWAMAAEELAFSILERIEVGETCGKVGSQPTRTGTFSILERIEVGETPHGAPRSGFVVLSVSSNGSKWVKHSL